MAQSYDGQLTFFEQEVQSFSRLLPGFLLPGPLAYMAPSDSFITATAGLELVSYRYNSIAAANWDPKQQQGRVACEVSVLCMVRSRRLAYVACVCSARAKHCGTKQTASSCTACIVCWHLQVVQVASRYRKTGRLCWERQRWTSSVATSPLLLMAQVRLRVTAEIVFTSTTHAHRLPPITVPSPFLSLSTSLLPLCLLLPGSVTPLLPPLLLPPLLLPYVLRFTNSAPSILVLAEHTFFILDLYGHILVQRRLDHHPSCFWSYPANPTATSTDTAAAAKGGSANSRGPAAVVQAENLLIATHTKALQVYRGQQLAWAAQLELVPVAVRVTSIAGVRGMIVALDDSGEQCLKQHSCHGIVSTCSLDKVLQW